jgi:prephenate dehydratase
MTDRGDQIMGRVVDATTARKPRVAFQGERGAYGDEAIGSLWRGHAFPLASWGFDDVVRAVASGKADYGVLPVENAIVGAIAPTAAALRSAPVLTVVDEITIEISHALLALPGATLAGIRSVASHPVALRQCGRFLERHPHLTPHASYDTAGAAREVAAHGRLDEAAIASVMAAERYRLSVIAEDVQDVPRNWTRFVVVARGPDGHRPGERR